LFHDGAVLQRDAMIPVWGWAEPGTRIQACCGGAPATAVADDRGHWLLRLPPLPAGGPHTLTLEDGHGHRLQFQDILIGDVWVCSGQSNMEYKLQQVDPDGSQSRGIYLPQLRLLTVATPAQPGPQTAIGARWTPATPESLAAFSAVAGWFGRRLHEELGIPIGLIVNAWGGTRIQAWLSREALATDPEARLELEPYERRLHGIDPNPEKSYDSADSWFQAEGPEDPVNHGLERDWHQPLFNDQTWSTMDLPRRWQDDGHNFNGIVWFRRRIELPPAWRGRPLRLNLGSIDKHDETYVNGVLVGTMGWENQNSWCTPRSYTVAADITRDAAALTIAVRVRSHIYHGGITGPSSLMTLHPKDAPDDSISLVGPWRFAIEQNWGVINLSSQAFAGCGPGGPNAPYTLFNSRIAPLIPYAIRGWTWYQGESNEGQSALYRRLLPLLIRDWRRAWGQGDLPFLIVQLAAFHPPQEHPVESGWAEIRAAQAAALRLPHTGLATAIDVGDATDVHPKDKKTVGLRLARWALSRVYGRGGTPCGPLLRSCTPEAPGRLRLSFDHADGLHTLDGGPVRHLAIAGADGRFVWAESRIEGSDLIVSHPSIAQPAAVRYAWADNPEGSNLANGDGLPAFPFDTRDLLH
jgi:sialate O-acetylesterase